MNKVVTGAAVVGLAVQFISARWGFAPNDLAFTVGAFMCAPAAGLALWDFNSKRTAVRNKG